MLLPSSGNPFKRHEEVSYLQPMIRFDIPPLIEGCSEGLDAFRFFFKQPDMLPFTHHIVNVFDNLPPMLVGWSEGLRSSRCVSKLVRLVV